MGNLGTVGWLATLVLFFIQGGVFGGTFELSVVLLFLIKLFTGCVFEVFDTFEATLFLTQGGVLALG